MEPTTAEPFDLDSEDEVDATLDNQPSESSSEASSTDCTGLRHLFDREDTLDRYESEDEGWLPCDHFPCPNRYDQAGVITQDSRDWASIPHPSQVPAELVPLPQSPEAWEEVPLPSSVEPSPSPSPSPTPLPPVSTTPPPRVPTPLIPPELLDLVPELDFTPEPTEDFTDSPQFFLLTMGDIKVDSVPVLSSASQYIDWAAKMKGYLMFMNCWDSINSTMPAATEADAQKEWKKANAQASGLIFMRTSQSFHYLFDAKADGTSLTAKEMWDKLIEKFGKPNSAHVWSLFENLISDPRMSDQRPLQDQISRLVTRIREISANGIKLEENVQALILLSKVPDSYRSMISALMATTELSKITVDTILEKSLAEESMRRTGQAASRISKTKPKPSGPCDHCGSATHHESTCYKKHPELRPKGKGNGGKKKDKGKGKDNPTHNHAHTVAPSANVLVASESSEAPQMHASFYGAANAAGARHTRWLMDSGASQHVTWNLSDFSSYTPYENPINFSTAENANLIQGIGEGTVEAETYIDGVKWKITLPNVCYVPQASSRLFSTGTIEKNGYSLFQGDGKMSIFDKLPKGAVKHGATISIPGRKVLEATYTPESNLYNLLLEITSGNQLHLNIRSHQLWHRRFGHAGKEALSRLPKNVKGVDAVDPADSTPCEGCAFGKSHRLPFPPSEKRATEELELIHTDLDGPMRTASIGGHFYYYAGFLDDKSGLGRTYFIKQKSQAIEAFDDFKVWAETQTGKKIKKVRSDRGGEYLSKEFTDHLRKHGIEHQKTVAKSPQQNGRAERWNRTIMEKALAMLHQAGLSHGFWVCAVETANHIYNRQPMRRLKWRCPITAWDGTVPDVSYFRVFGCKAYVHVHKTERAGKLDKKAVEMIFVGYEPGSKGYKFWNPATRSFVVSRDVTFDEESFPAHKLPGNRPTTPGDSPFPDHTESSDATSNVDPDDEVPIPLPDIPLPDPLPEVVARPPSPPPPPPPAKPPVAPAAPAEPEQPPPPPPVPPPRPSHQRQRHEPVGEPSIAKDRPRRLNVPKPAKYRDSTYGDESPARIDARTRSDGTQQAESLLSFLAAAQYKSGLPNSHREAMKSSEAEKWKLAEKAEYESLLENKTWVLVPRPKDRHVVSNRWVYDIKHDGRYKARLVAKGFTQIWGEDYHETFSPVARFESIRYLLAHAALEDWDIESMDVKTAFLNGDLEEEIYMEQPEGWAVRGKENHVCLLKKAIYGLKQASRQWNAKIHKSLLDLGFERTYSDAGVYVYRRQGGDFTTIVVLYVDDLLLFGDRPSHIKHVKDALKKQYKMTDLGPVQRFLGLRITRDRSTRTIDIDQTEYIQSVLERFGMADCKPARTPLPAGAVLEASDQPATDSFRQRYQSLIGSLLYATLGTRPDIDFAVTRLSKYNAQPSSAHWNYATYILRYLQGTKDLRLRYHGASNDGLLSYSDSDYAEDRDDRHSTSGFVFLMAGGAVSWASRRQPTISLSSTEAEYKAASDTCRQMTWLRTFGHELGDDISRPTPLCLDNQGSIFLSVNPVTDRRIKHVEVRYHYIREQVECGDVDIFYVATADQLADALTKNVSFSILDRFRKGIGLVTSAS